jgi:hypothetical protein
LGDAALAGATVIEHVRVGESGQWSVRLRRPEETPAGRRTGFLLEGDWLGESGVGQGRRLVVDQNDYRPETIGLKYEMGPWTFDADAGRWFASRVETIRPDGHRLQVLECEGFERLPRGGLEAVLREPTFDRSDVVRGGETRGGATLRVINDLGRGIRKERDQDGRVVVMANPETRGRAPSVSRWEITGYGMMSVTAVFVAWGAWKRWTARR